MAAIHLFNFNQAESPNERNVFIFLDAIAEFIEKSQDQNSSSSWPHSSQLEESVEKRGQLMLKQE